ncbi:MAG: tetratricopeptide repeat protein [Lachnospiraceae bacterium]|nr:tetratricopeptide repeat protein [Lachnospiraceae bacterium]
MNSYDKTLRPEDYVEPRCVLCDEPYGKMPQVKAIPQQRIIEKMNAYMSCRDYAGAERHLLYWLEEARLGFDRRGELLVCNELVGHYRKVNDKEKALVYGEKALSLIKELAFEGTISAGTTYVNVATACNAFGENERAMSLFEKARAAYEDHAFSAGQGIDGESGGSAGQIVYGNREGFAEQSVYGDHAVERNAAGTDPSLLGGLYNNMALTCVSLGRFEEAYDLYQKALEQMKQVKGGALEQAITWLNIANAIEYEQGMEAGETKIFDCLDNAENLLRDQEAPRDGYYAFVCEKCAPTFSYYGYFLTAEELQKTAEEIYREAD